VQRRPNLGLDRPRISAIDKPLPSESLSEGSRMSARGTKINSPDPALSAVCTAYPAEPLLTFFDPPIELAGSGPRRRLHLDRRINCTAVRFAVLVRIEIHI
jgi:hypothetical protein